MIRRQPDSGSGSALPASQLTSHSSHSPVHAHADHTINANSGINANIKITANGIASLTLSTSCPVPRP